MIQNTNLAERLYDATNSDGFKMLLALEALARSMATGQRAHIIYLQASKAVLVPLFKPTAGNAAHSFNVRCLGYREIARWAPGSCDSDAYVQVLSKLVHKSDERIKNSIEIF